jgi:PTH1 family peptidyl-tRNA hydrolase
MMVADTPSDKILAILGLGNPGRRYAKNRHNFGYMVLDRIAFLKMEEFVWSDAGLAYCRIELPTTDLILAKPTTYMNNSGRAALGLYQDFGVAANCLMVVCDDCNLPLGKMRFRARGSDGGHNGLESIIGSLETKDFPRLRLGIGLNPPDVPLEEYVLEDFNQDEMKTVDKVVERAIELIEELIIKGYEASSKTLTVA